jgi:sirohydrochlorin cobaltochelatase
LDDNNGTEKKYVFVCTNVDCRVRGATKVLDRLQSRVNDHTCPANVEVREYMCFGGCHDGPNVIVYPDKVWYGGVQESDADTIVDKHLTNGETVTPLTGKVAKDLEDLIFQLLDSGIY